LKASRFVPAPPFAFARFVFSLVSLVLSKRRAKQLVATEMVYYFIETINKNFIIAFI
jgi:hypothetical protein